VIVLFIKATGQATQADFQRTGQQIALIANGADSLENNVAFGVDFDVYLRLPGRLTRLRAWGLPDLSSLLRHLVSPYPPINILVASAGRYPLSRPAGGFASAAYRAKGLWGPTGVKRHLPAAPGPLWTFP